MYIRFNSALKRYVMLISNDTTFAYAESVHALHWTVPIRSVFSVQSPTDDAQLLPTK